MRTVVAVLLAAVAEVLLSSVAGATPPEDVAAYCRAAYPQVQFQVRCLNVENGAADRVSRVAAGADRDAFNGCLAISPSWAAMESCLTQVARGGLAGSGAGVSGPLGAGREPAAARPDVAPPPGSVAGVPPAQAPADPAAAPGTPLGIPGALLPQPGAGVPPGLPAIAAEPERPTRPIPEADADRLLRSVLERAGTPGARCKKKQYGPGWVIICE
jgi:hypothetical protein